MSTFKGIVAEFPNIRIDYFCPSPFHQPALACFLSHVHSDHLAGLETLKAPFVYCSPATREMVLRLERFPHRVNFARGVLEARRVTYRRLGGLLKPIPLETPTVIELSPGHEIQVTLFDANHCTGSVMFLIEGNDKAILYTGDMRSEPSFINSIRRNPFLIEYTRQQKRLDCIYLDTSFTENTLSFPPKDEGIAELLKKVKKYPSNTVFHFAAWTFGYEEVWMALSKALKCQIHVDDYKMRIYNSLRGRTEKTSKIGPPITPEASILAGYSCGNSDRPGCLTADTTVRLHSCGKETDCPAMNNPEIVWIRPIIARTEDETEIAEAGIGGGGGDLVQKFEVELDDLRKVAGFDLEEDELDLKKLVEGLADSMKNLESPAGNGDSIITGRRKLPKVITFPYSRHSSYAELCDFVKTFEPWDVYPCTVDEDAWHEDISVDSLFGRCCFVRGRAKGFRHDKAMRELKRDYEDAISLKSGTTERSEIELDQSQRDNVAMRTMHEFYRDDEGHLHVRDRKVPSGAPTQSSRSSGQPGTSETESSQIVDSRDIQTELEREQNQTYESTQLSPGYLSGDSTAGSSHDTEFAFDSGSQRTRRESIMAAFQRSQSKRKREIWDDGSNLYSYFEYETEDLNTSRWDTSQDVGVDIISYWDPTDEVYRCKKCGYEVWQPYGDCQGCDTEGNNIWNEFWPEGAPYVPENYPEIVGASDIDSQVACDIHDALADKYMDNDSSAYDSYDECPRVTDEYEIDSFIDDSKLDAASEAQSELSQPVSDDSYAEVEGQNWEELYVDLLIDHENLTDRFDLLHENHHELIEEFGELHDNHELLHMDFDRLLYGGDRHHISSSPEISDLDELEDMAAVDSDESSSPPNIVDVEVQDPQLAEVTIESQSQNNSQTVGQGEVQVQDSITDVMPESVRDAVMDAVLQAVGESQATDLTDGVIERRAEGWENAERGTWPGLLSTDDNHTMEEPEL